MIPEEKVECTPGCFGLAVLFCCLVIGSFFIGTEPKHKDPMPEIIWQVCQKSGAEGCVLLPDDDWTMTEKPDLFECRWVFEQRDYPRKTKRYDCSSWDVNSRQLKR